MAQHAQDWFRVLKDCSQYLEKRYSTRLRLVLQIFLRAGNNPAMLKNSTEHAEPSFISLIVLDLSCH